MQQFDLSLWLQDKSRKVVTRDGRPVRIVCWDKENASSPIVFLIKDSEQDCSYEYINCANIEGKADSGLGSDDLFFADEEEELTEFERELEMMMVSFSNENLGSDVRKEMPKQKLHSYAHRLLDIARKEIENGAVEFAKSYMEDVNQSFEKVKESEELWKWKMSCLRGINKAYTKGKEDALKDLPKWKKATEDKDFDRHVLLLEDDRVVIASCVYKDEYHIELDDLKTLPKEE